MSKTEVLRSLDHAINLITENHAGEWNPELVVIRETLEKAKTFVLENTAKTEGEKTQ
jgi:hypothetical protein